MSNTSNSLGIAHWVKTMNAWKMSSSEDDAANWRDRGCTSRALARDGAFVTTTSCTSKCRLAHSICLWFVVPLRRRIDDKDMVCLKLPASESGLIWSIRKEGGAFFSRPHISSIGARLLGRLSTSSSFSTRFEWRRRTRLKEQTNFLHRGNVLECYCED